MSKYLDKKVLDNIEMVTPIAEKELKFIQSIDWSEINNLKKRETAYKLQDMLNSRNIDALIKLHSLALGDLRHPKVKRTVDVLISFYTLLEQRYINMDKKFDWTKFSDEDFETHSEEEDGKKSVEKKQAEEIEFQHYVLKDYSAFKEKLRKINFGEDQAIVDIPIHGDTPIPIMMSEVIEERYPEVSELIKNKLEDE